MKLKSFKLTEHYALMKAWLERRGMTAPDFHDIPSIGYVASHSGAPIAMAFLRKIEGRQAKLDYLISNPDESPSLRDKANDLLTEMLIISAQIHGVRQLYAHTIDENTRVRAKKFGFQEFPHSLLAINLRKGSD